MSGKTPQGLSATQLTALCAQWPGVTHDVKWENNLVFSVGGKMFVMTPVDGSDGGRLSFKVANERFLELTDQPGIVPAAYLARARWVTVIEPQRHHRATLEVLILDAYSLVRARLAKKLQATLSALPAMEDEA